MKYDISKSTAPTMPNLGKGTKCIKFLLKEAQKACVNPWFRCFSLSLAHTSAVQNFSIRTSVGRKYVASLNLAITKLGVCRKETTNPP